MIYLDHSATTPIDEEVLKVMEPYFKVKFGNASSIHSYGQRAKSAVEKSREMIAQFLNASPEEIIFTSGGTESDNLAIRGIVSHCEERDPSLRSGQAPQSPRRETASAVASLLSRSDNLPHLITSKIEHHAVLNTVKKLEREGKIEATYLPVDRGGVVKLPALKRAIKDNTILISVIFANNEVGTIEPIAKIGKMLKEINKKREEIKLPRIYFHTDAVQAAGYLDLDVEKLGVNLLTLTAHKIYGPTGIGILFIKKGTPLQPEITGGEQENGLRAGTENTPGIVGLATAVAQIADNRKQITGARRLRDKLETGLKEKIPGIIVNGDLKNRLPNISNISFPGAEAESILMMLDQEGTAASSGSACTSASLEPSHVLLAMGIDHLVANTTIRFSLGKENTKQEIDYLIKILPGIIKKLRHISGKG